MPRLCGGVRPQITEKDEAALAFLVDVRDAKLTGEDERGFELTFTFKENPFFTNKRAPRPLSRPPRATRASVERRRGAAVPARRWRVG